MSIRLSWLGLILCLLVACGGGTTPANPSGGTNSSNTNPATAGGTARFRDRLAVADQLTVQLTGAAPLTDDQIYQGWLVTDNQSSAVSVGAMKRGADGAINHEWNSPTSENLPARYSRFQVTVEPARGSAKPTGKVVFSGELAGDTLKLARKLFATNPDDSSNSSSSSYGYGNDNTSNKTAQGTALAVGLKAQIELAAQHTQNATNAAAIGSAKEMQVHLEHVINILEGTKGSRFGDHNKDGATHNPGDGYGVILYARELVNALGEQAVGAVAKDVLAQINAVEDKCLSLIVLSDMAAATLQLRELKALTDKLQSDAVAKIYTPAQEKLSFTVTAVK